MRRPRVDDAETEVGGVPRVERPAVRAAVRAVGRAVVRAVVEEQQAARPAHDLPAEQRDRERAQRLEHRPVPCVRGEGVVQRPPARGVGDEREVVQDVGEIDDLRPERPRDRAQRSRHVDEVRHPELGTHARVAHVPGEDARLGGREEPRSSRCGTRSSSCSSCSARLGGSPHGSSRARSG